MSLTRLQLKTFVIRLGKIGSNDATSLGGINDDLNFALEIIAAKRGWPQLITTATLSLTSNDGDISYALATDVDEVEQLRITSPQSYSRVLTFVGKEYIREQIPNKLIPGRSPPMRWYFMEPSLDATTNAETKQVSFDYRPDQSYTITYSYKKFAPTMDADGAFPFFDPTYHLYPAYFALWKYAERVKQPSLDPIYWRGEWEAGLQTILEDEQGQTRHLRPIPGPDMV